MSSLALLPEGLPHRRIVEDAYARVYIAVSPKPTRMRSPHAAASVQMIEEFYASHIKNMVDASVINVRRSKPLKARTRKAKSGPSAH
jgi:hypothetical protein